MTDNEYVDTSATKGVISGFSVFEEHTNILSNLSRETKADKGDPRAVWFDLAHIANAYSTILHKLIEKALDHYYIPDIK